MNIGTKNTSKELATAPEIYNNLVTFILNISISKAMPITRM